MLLGTLSSQGEGGRSEPLNVRLGLLCRRPNTAICTGSQIVAETVKRLYFFPALQTFWLTFVRMRDKYKIINVQRNDTAFMT